MKNMVLSLDKIPSLEETARSLNTSPEVVLHEENELKLGLQPKYFIKRQKPPFSGNPILDFMLDFYSTIGRISSNSFERKKKHIKKHSKYNPDSLKSFNPFHFMVYAFAGLYILSNPLGYEEEVIERIKSNNLIY